MRAINHQGVLIDTCLECRGVWLDRGEPEKIAASLDGDDHGKRGPDDRRHQSKLSRLMDFFG